METTKLPGRITRRGFLDRSSALAAAGLIGNAYATNSVLSSERTADSTKPSAVPLAGKLALEEHFVLAETIDTSYAVRALPPETRQKILDLGGGRIADMDRGGVDVLIGKRRDRAQIVIDRSRKVYDAAMNEGRKRVYGEPNSTSGSGGRAV